MYLIIGKTAHVVDITAETFLELFLEFYEKFVQFS